MCFFVVFFFKQKTAYEMRISDWSSDVCSSDLAHSSDLELEDHGWRECKCEPRRYVTDVETGSIRFDSIPTCDGSLEIEVARLPLRQLVSPEDCPELPQQYHADIVYWMLYRAWSKRDADAGREAKSDTALAQFASPFRSDELREGK